MQGRDVKDRLFTLNFRSLLPIYLPVIMYKRFLSYKDPNQTERYLYYIECEREPIM